MAGYTNVLVVLALVAREANIEVTEHLYKRTEFLQVAMQILLEGRHKGGGGVLDPEKAEAILASVSLELHSHLAHGATDEVFSIIEIEKAIELTPPHLLYKWQGAREFIRDISNNSNIIYSVDTLRRSYRYLHRTFREFFAALELSKLPRDQRNEKLLN